MASVTGSIARGFLVASSSTDGSTAAAATAATTPAAVTASATATLLGSVAAAAAATRSVGTAGAVGLAPATIRLSGVGLNLGAAIAPPLIGAASGRSDLFADLRSALAGFDAQSGFDRALVTQLIGAD